MIWHYSCPNCRQDVEIDWDRIKDEGVCPHCGTTHFAPTPGEDHTGYIVGEAWPPEMEEAVVALRGSACIAPGCYREHTTLVPRVPFTRGGRLSVENLLPACSEHGATRGEDEYGDWLSRPGARRATDCRPSHVAGPAPDGSASSVRRAFCSRAGFKARSLLRMVARSGRVLSRGAWLMAEKRPTGLYQGIQGPEVFWRERPPRRRATEQLGFDRAHLV